MKARKLLWRLVLALAVLVVLALGAAWLLLDHLARAAIERGGTYAMQVETTAGGASISPFRGRLGVTQVRVANPQGYASPHLLSVGQIELDMQPGSLLGRTVHVRRLRLENVDLHIEQTLGLQSNISKVLGNLKRLRSPEHQPAEAGRKVRIDTIAVRNVQAHVHLPALPGRQRRTVQVHVPLVELHDVGTDRPEGVRVAEVVRQLLPAIIAAVLSEAGDVLPPGLRQALRLDLSGTVEGPGGG